MPTPVNAQQAENLALSLRASAAAASACLHDQWNDLSDDGRSQIHDYEYDLLSLSDDMYALAGKLVLDDTMPACDELQASIDDGNAFITKINDEKKTIGICAAIVGLATALVSKNPSQIVSAAKGLKTAMA